jgi:hypothetical protein
LPAGGGVTLSETSRSEGSDAGADLARVRRELKRLQGMRLFRPLSDVEAADYEALCAQEAALLEAAGPAVWPPRDGDWRRTVAHS